MTLLKVASPRHFDADPAFHFDEDKGPTCHFDAVLRIWILGIHMFFGLPDPDTLVRDTDPAPDPDPSIIQQR
jgi:hypothetical protein